MSKKDVSRIIERASSDLDFLNQLNRDPGKALSGFDLTSEERAALLAGDSAALEAMGIDARVTKGQAWN